MMSQHAFYFVVDDRLAPVASTVARRLVDLWQQDVHIFVESSSVYSEYRIQMPGIYYHHNVLGQFLPDNLPESRKWPKIVYMRLFAPQFLTSYDRLAYLDADILPLRSDPQLWTLPLGNSIAAVQDFEVTHDAPAAVGMDKRQWLDSIGVRGERYFNSGVLLFDTQYWLKVDIGARLSEFVGRYAAGMKMFDQDFLNFVFQDNWRELSPAWNYQASLFGVGLEDLHPPVFLHFSKIEKPWMGQFIKSVEDIDNFGHSFLSKLAISAGVDLSGLLSPKKINPISRFKYSLRRKASEHGFQTKKERRLRQAVAQKYANLASYFHLAIEERRFADSPVQHGLPDNREAIFDGKALRMPASNSLRSALNLDLSSPEKRFS